ncbi:MAG: caspase family protein [Verrucomicrobia bacterium]|nr:caspase family protein [Verrucomicrobiota bacterium]MBU1736264.1 caspase family protein [Verrucomicrobiota bacterium]MBU1857662.1 caspase family protein [Verrucomicrobiota bacterium]
MQLTIRRGRHAWLLVGALLCAAATCNAADPIESGQYKSGSLDTNTPTHVFGFYAVANDAVIVRVAEEDSVKQEIPDVSIKYRVTTNLLAATSNNITVCDLQLPITNTGWFDVYCTLPTSLLNYSNALAYSISMLRMPYVPPSYGDLDVGDIYSGEYLWGTINVGADLDVATIAVSNRCTVQVRMGQDDIALVPSIQIYDPYGNLVTTNSPPPPDYCSEVTATLTNVGIYTVVCNDYENGIGRYAVSMIKIPGTLWATDTDLGIIISGETKTGTINVPGDLDAALFSAVSGDVVQVTMSEVDSEVNPVIELYNPEGLCLATGTAPLKVTAVITNTLATNGTFTVICKDAYDRKQNIHYTLTMECIGGPSSLEKPAAPTGLNASDGIYSNLVEITWNAVTSANGYDLWRSYGTNDSVLICTNLTTIIYQDANVVTNVIYYYKAKSRNDSYGISTNFSNTDSGYCGTSLTTAMRRALLVGIDNYSPSYGPSSLNCCTNDANGMRDIFMLGDPSNRWSSTNLTLLTDRQATKVTIQNALQTLASASSAGDLAVYFHSSHGGQSAGSNPSNTFICTYDASFTDAELAADLALFRTDTKVIIILDTCYSGGMFKLDGSPEVEWLFAERVMEHYHNIQQARFKSLGKSAPKTLGQNIAFMTACDYDELSWESDYYGLYTGYLLNGCTLPAVDTDGDDQYSFLELHTYAAAEAVAERPTQHAQDYNPTQLQNTIARAVGSNGVAATHLIYNDFDGDRASDLATFNPSTGYWRIASLKRWMLLGWDNFVWGGPGFKPIDGDYDGDRASDANVYNEQTGEWRIGSLKRLAVIIQSEFLGGPGLTPVSGDYNGDRVSDAALYEQPDGYWYILTTTCTQLVWGTSYTGTGFVPVSGDYDGDRINDLAMYHLKTGYWYIGSLVNSTIIIWGKFWGGVDMVPVSGDYDGDGYSDLAVYQSTTGNWYIWSLHRSAAIANGIKLGGPGYTPVPGDYDGDGYDDLAVYQSATGYWLFLTADGSSSYSLLTAIGGPGYIPVLPTW